MEWASASMGRWRRLCASSSPRVMKGCQSCFLQMPRSDNAPTSCCGRFLSGTCLVVILAGWAAIVSTNGPKFLDDDPITREPETQDASKAAESEIGLLFELSYNLFAVANHTPSNTRAGNVNTIDEVPDSSWFTNRI